jgi:hypothetical protein
MQAAAESRRSSAGLLLDTDHRAPLARLAGDTHGLPYLMTGLPELDRRADGDPSDAVVITHAWNLDEAKSGQREKILYQARALEKLLVPLLRTDLRIEVRNASGLLPPDDAEILRHILSWIRERQNLPSGRIGLVPDAGWSILHRARAVLVLGPKELMTGLVAGIRRIWWLPFALPPVEADLPRQQIVASCVLTDEEDLVRWVADSGWERSPRGASAIVRLLRPLTDGHASERVAQTILAALEG